MALVGEGEATVDLVPESILKEDEKKKHQNDESAP